MYALATVPLINKVKTNGLCQVWDTDDAAGGRKLASLKQWWNNSNLKVSKKQKKFLGTNVNITTRGIKYLGTPLGNHKFCRDFLQAKIKEWTIQIEKLSSFAQSQPHAAHCIYTWYCWKMEDGRWNL
ncbi:uncharacterized protein LOC134189875 [Corticium candelabrum]|uniref:uncharacterized protein LOC134189875 n=1 Tax=Corticium candelabrum TaxID=121492 RepID=UPI002E26106F|nr:uncharacterized protein LOC134189875 [Corticium candelabrum]